MNVTERENQMGEQFSDEFHVLTKAQDVLREYGWRQGNGEDERSEYCILDAVNKATEVLWGPDLCTEDEHYSRSGEAFYTCVRTLDTLAKERGVRSIVSWNDETGRTQQEVLDLLAQAATQHT